MNSPPHVGFLGRTFGWSGSRREWLTLSGVVAWLAVGFALWHYSKRWTIGETVLAGCLWILSLVLAAHDAVRKLFGPVFFYDIVRVGRQRQTFWLRWAYVLLIAGTLGLMYWSWLESNYAYRHRDLHVSTGELARFGTTFFNTFISIQFLVVVLLTPVYVAGTIVVEKERKTLEFLFATDLANREIIFGKLASRVVNLLMYIFAGLPVLAFAQLFGGIDPELVLATFVATVTTVIGLSALSIWFSTFMRKARDAIMLTYLSYIAYCWASTFIAAYTNIAPFRGWWNEDITLLGITFGFHDFTRWFAEGNIFWQIIMTQAPRGAISTTEESLRQYVIWWAVMTLLLVGHAILRLRVVALQQAYGAPAGTKSRKKKVATTAGSESVVVNVATSKLPPLTRNPMFWKEVFVDSGIRGGCAWKLIVGVILLIIFSPLVMICWSFFFEKNYWAGFAPANMFFYFQRDINAWLRVATGGMCTLMCFAAALRGAGAISGEKDKDTWISLMSTPLTAAEMLNGKFWGCVLGVRRVFFVLLLIWSIGLALGAVDPFLILLDTVLIAMYVCAFSWIGLYSSMTARTTLIASVRAFFVSLFLLGGYWLIFVLCCVLPLALFGPSSGNEFYWFIQFLCGLCPPLVSGWLPLNVHHSFRDRDFEPFEANSNGSIGLAAPIVATMIWLGFTIFLYFLCHWKFREVTNREAERSPLQRPEKVKTGRYE